ncbi:MAG: hypothetical protein AB1489_43460 [Acidobacteriota bacterium]
MSSERSQSRRRFVRDTIAGAALAALGISTTNKPVASSDCDSYTDLHVDDFINNIIEIELTPDDVVQWQETQNAILEAVETDSNSKATFDAVNAWLSNTLISIPPEQEITQLDVPVDLSMMISAAYLRAIAQLRNNQSPSLDQIRERMSDPKRVFDAIEPDFVTKLYERLKVETQNSDFANRIEAATNSIAELVSNASAKHHKNRPERHNLVICFVNGVPMPCILALILIGIVVVIIIVESTNRKRRRR